MKIVKDTFREQSLKINFFFKTVSKQVPRMPEQSPSWLKPFVPKVYNVDVGLVKDSVHVELRFAMHCFSLAAVNKMLIMLSTNC